jgi:starch synthase
MRVAHLLRKYNPDQWGGTETAVRRLLDGLSFHNVDSVVFAPALDTQPSRDPLGDSGIPVKEFKACAPVWNISEEQRELLISVGGNLMSFDLLGKLLQEKNLAVIHAHTGNRLGGIALTAAKIRKIPFVVTIHGGVLDLPENAKKFLREPLQGGIEWGKFFGWMFGSRKVLQDADVILTCNQKEAALQRERFPNKRVVVQPHAVPADVFQQDQRGVARKAFPQIVGKDVLLVCGRIDPVKNQDWLVNQAPEIFRRFPNTMLVFVGSCTNAGYGKMIENRIQKNGLGEKILLTGGLPPRDPRLIGLFQEAKVVLLPSLAETFGLVILEAWAANNPVIASRTSGALDLIQDRSNGLLFDLENPAAFHQALETVLTNRTLAAKMAAAGQTLAVTRYDTKILGGKVKHLYEELIEAKKK